MRNKDSDNINKESKSFGGHSMAFEVGGRADKMGNRFEFNWTISKLLDVIEEQANYIEIETIGEDEQGIDLWICDKKGNREGQQCKARNGNKEYWTYAAINAKGILDKWKKHLSTPNNSVSLVSPLSFIQLEDVTQRARNTNIDKPKLFYEFQIKKSGKTTQTFFDEICHKWEIDCNTSSGNIKAIDYFSRIYYHQTPDSEQYELIKRRLNILFSDEPDNVYYILLEYILTKNILAKKIDKIAICKYLSEKGINFRNLSHDQTIYPRIQQLNREFSISFVKLKCGILFRTESKECIEFIQKNCSLIIHGNAGMGKSGCTENIIDFCNKNDIPYLAIKLDTYTPKYNSSKWGELLRLPASITHCLDSISSERRGIIILDQLDALRWSSVNASDAINVCWELIDEVKGINKKRKYPISLVFVCRTYDLEHDKTIQYLFGEDNSKEIVWKKVLVNELRTEEVKNIVGNCYNEMSCKLQILLRTISNLYIWEHLDNGNGYHNIETTPQLVKEWWEQICSKSKKYQIQEKELQELKERMVSFCNNKGEIAIPYGLIREHKSCIDYLVSNGIIITTCDKTSFVHQSLLDCFLADKMLESYYEDKTIDDILGGREKQTPNRRYQALLFVQQLNIISAKDFLEFGKKLLSSNARFSFKSIFLEIMNQVENPDECLKEYVLEQLNSVTWKEHFINTVIRGNVSFVRLLREKNWLSNLATNKEFKQIAVDIFASIAPQYNIDDIRFLKNQINASGDQNSWNACFTYDIRDGIDEYFDLRISLYKKNPYLLNWFYSLKEIFNSSESRAVKIISLLLEYSTSKSQKQTYNKLELFIEEDSNFIIKDYRNIIDSLLPLFPKPQEYSPYSNWSEKYSSYRTIERVCVQLIKRANCEFAKTEPDEFLEYYKNYMGTGCRLYNEIVLYGLLYLPPDYADTIITYLASDLEKNTIEDSSNNECFLTLTKQIIEKFSIYCSLKSFDDIESKIVHFKPSNITEIYKQNKEYSEQFSIYSRNFWGYYQMELLPCLSQKQIKDSTASLISCLQRNKDIKNSCYRHLCSRIGSVVSPIDGKKLNSNQWKNIIRNKRINFNHRWNEVKNVYIESSVRKFADSFRDYATNNVEEAIKLLINIDTQIPEEYIESLYSAMSNPINKGKYSLANVEILIDRYGYSLESYSATYICEIIENHPDYNWSEKILNVLSDIALHHKSPDINKPDVCSYNDTNIKSCEMLIDNAFNSIRGQAAKTIGMLLSFKPELYNKFREVISKMTSDANPVIKFASLWCLLPMIENNSVQKEIIDILKKDYRCVLVYNMKSFFINYFKTYSNDLLVILDKTLSSPESELQEFATYTIVNLFFDGNLKDDRISKIAKNHKTRNFAIRFIISYLRKEAYRKEAKQLLIEYIKTESSVDGNEFVWAQLFKNDIVKPYEDYDLIASVLKSKINRCVMTDIYEYVNRNHCINQYSSILLSMCKSAIKENKQRKIYLLEKTIVKLVISIYSGNSEATSQEQKQLVNECLDIWDLMYEKNSSAARQLTSQLMKA